MYNLRAGKCRQRDAVTDGKPTAWRHILAHASNWHKTEVKIFNSGSLSPKLTHFPLTNKEVEVMTEII